MDPQKGGWGCEVLGCNPVVQIERLVVANSSGDGLFKNAVLIK
jgi:hypothetical protein